MSTDEYNMECIDCGYLIMSASVTTRCPNCLSHDIVDINPVWDDVGVDGAGYAPTARNPKDFCRNNPCREDGTPLVTPPERPSAKLFTAAPEEFGKAAVEAAQGGVKYDQGKARWDLLPMDAINDVARVLMYGATKYKDRNWEKGMDWGRLHGAALRHLAAWSQGTEADEETGLSHLAHAACCVLMLLAYEKRGLGKDTRK